MERMTRRKFLKYLSITTGAFIMAGCCPQEIQTTVEPTLQHSSTPTQYITTTPEATNTLPQPTEIPTPQRPDLSGEGGLYNEQQKALIASGAYQDQEEALSRWITDYWGFAKEPPFNAGNLMYQYVFDLENPQSAGVLIENLDNFKTYYFPIQNGVFMKVPPEVPADGKFLDIPVGFGPLELTRGEYILGRFKDEWVRFDEYAKVKNFLDLEFAEWMEFQYPNPDINNINNIPEMENGRNIEIAEVKSVLTKLLKSEEFAYRTGIIPNFGPEVRPFASLSSTYLKGYYEFEMISLPSSEESKYTDFSMNARPLKLIDFQKINIDSHSFVLMTQAVAYKEGKVTFLITQPFFCKFESEKSIVL